MKKKIAAILATGLIATTLCGCEDVQFTDIKVSHRDDTSYVYFRNGYKPGNVIITKNDDGSYSIIIEGIPPQNFLSN